MMRQRNYHSFLITLLAAFALSMAFVALHPTQAAAEDKKPEAAEVEKEEKAPKKKKKEKANEQANEEDDHESNYFGISTTGKEIIYVLDNSNSMTNGRFNAAAAELLTSVKNLREDQSYYVVLFSDTAYRLGHPNPVKGMQKPTEENIAFLEYWLAEVELCLRTDAADAIMAALATKPDTIYLLTDGSFTDDTMKQLNAVKSSKARIHTIGLSINKDKAIQDLEAIADRFGGEYREVELNAEKKKKFAKPKRKTNNRRGEVWGITLKKG